MEKKKTHKLRIALIVMASLILVSLFIPVPYKVQHTINDAGSTGVRSFFRPIYDVKNCRERYRWSTVLDGVAYNYVPNMNLYIVGTQVTIFGHMVFDDTHVDPPLEEHLKYEDEVKEIIDYYNSHQVNDIELGSISVIETDTCRQVSLFFGPVKEIVVSDQIVKVIKDYLDENPDSFIYNDFSLMIQASYQELVEKTATSESWRPYQAQYFISIPDKKVTELVLTPAMIPDIVPEGYDFEEVQKISFSFVSSVSKDKELVLRSIYPNAEIDSE